MQIQLPKLKKVNLNRPKKKKILLLSDQLTFKSGVATQSRELVVGTAEHFDWVQIGAAIKHPDHGKILDLSDDVNREAGIDHSYVKIYCSDGYGSPDIVREILNLERPDAIMLFTDPRHFYWFWPMEHELRTHWKIPILYLSIWDSTPYAYWNLSFYSSCDLLLAISRQTHQIHKEVLKYGDVNFVDIGVDPPKSNNTLIEYLPHGINPKQFFPIENDAEFIAFERDFKEKNNVDFVVFFNNRNIRRKQPGDVILAYKTFCDKLPPEKAKKCCLLMKTSIQDENGTDLMAVKRAICPDYKILFNQEMLPEKVMNFFYNLSDIVINLGSNEGFGLSSLEALHSGKIILNNITGGLQDMCRFEDNDGNWFLPTTEIPSNHAGTHKNHGEWCFPVFPSNRSLQGSIPTPYIFDDRCKFEDVADTLFEIYNLPKEERKRRGLKGREWVLSEESGMSAPKMCEKFIQSVDSLLEVWQPKPKFSTMKVNERKKITNSGIVL